MRTRVWQIIGGLAGIQGRGAFAEEGLRDIKPPVDVPFPLSLVIWGLLFLTALVFGAGFYYWKIKLKTSSEKNRPLPHVIAYERIEALVRADLCARGKVQEHFTQLADIVRGYVEDRFLLRAPEMTTEEFFVSLKDLPRITPEHKELLRRFLDCCDLVKFAKHVPSTADIEATLASAKCFIKETQAVRAEVEDGV